MQLDQAQWHVGLDVHPEQDPQGAGGRLAKLDRWPAVERGVRIPPGLVVGEDPKLDAKRFRRTANGICLITQPMIDELG